MTTVSGAWHRTQHGRAIEKAAGTYGPATFVNIWRAIRDNLRNFFLSPPAEMQQHGR